MLAMSRNSGDYIVIGDDIIVQVVNIDGQIRLAIDAPRDIKIVRGENYEKDNPVPACIAQLREREDRPKPFRFQTANVSGSSVGRMK